MENNSVHEETMRAFIAQLQREQPDRIDGMNMAELLAFNYEQKSILLRFPIKEWMLNGLDHVHGGIIAALMDYSMGILCQYYAEPKLTPATNMQISYLRPVLMDGCVIVRAKCNSAGRTLAHATSEMMREKVPEKICATAVGTYFTKA